MKQIKINNEEEIVKLFEAGAHLGHKTNRVHPRSKKYIYRVEKGISIIDLTKTKGLLEQAKQFVTTLAKDQKVLLVVATKKIASSFVQDLCKQQGILHITHKWPAGLLTNFKAIMKNVSTLNSMKEEKATGAWEKFVKHERIGLQKKLNKLERLYGGIATLQKLPDALFVVDIKKEKNAVKEGKNNYIPIVAIVDTNADPTQVEFPIVANDDSLSSIQYLVSEIVGVYGKAKETVTQ